MKSGRSPTKCGDEVAECYGQSGAAGIGAKPDQVCRHVMSGCGDIGAKPTNHGDKKKQENAVWWPCHGIGATPHKQGLLDVNTERRAVSQHCAEESITGRIGAKSP